MVCVLEKWHSGICSSGLSFKWLGFIPYTPAEQPGLQVVSGEWNSLEQSASAGDATSRQRAQLRATSHHHAQKVKSRELRPATMLRAFTIKNKLLSFTL